MQHSVKIVADIGINHNADMGVVKKLIDFCAAFDVDYVKFQKRTPELCVPDSQKNIMRDTPWGQMTYLQYRNRMEFGKREYDEIAMYCRDRGIEWAASAWDKPSVEFLENYNVPFIKIPSACVTDTDLMDYAKVHPLIVSTGMCDEDMVDYLVSEYGNSMICLMHCTSTYPSQPEEQNLECISWMKKTYPRLTIGFSNHAPSSVPPIIAMGLGAKWIEIHITLSRAMWGSDQAASFEPEKVWRLVKYRDYIEAAMGDGVKKVYPSEIPIMQRLRRVNNVSKSA